jgi:hypothetical protein
VSVDPMWTVFAQENDAPELTPPGPYGRPIWEYISDSTTSHLWRQIFDKVQRTGDPLVVPVRCDSPTARRFLELLVSPRPVSGIRIDSTVVRIETRPAVLLFDLDRPRQGMLRMCSWCKRVQVEGAWVEVEEVVISMRLFERRTVPELTHGMCPECHATVVALIDDDR